VPGRRDWGKRASKRARVGEGTKTIMKWREYRGCAGGEKDRGRTNRRSGEAGGPGQREEEDGRRPPYRELKVEDGEDGDRTGQENGGRRRRRGEEDECRGRSVRGRGGKEEAGDSQEGVREKEGEVC